MKKLNSWAGNLLILLFDGLSYLCVFKIEDHKENCVSVYCEDSLENCATDIPQLQGINK